MFDHLSEEDTGPTEARSYGTVPRPLAVAGLVVAGFCGLNAWVLLRAGTLGVATKGVVILQVHLFLVGLLVWLSYRRRVDVATILGPRPTTRQAVATTVTTAPLYLCATGVSALYALAMTVVAPGYGQWLGEFDLPLWPDDPLSTGLAVVSAVGLGPIIEEYLFRGWLLRRWARKWGRTPAILLTSALFAALHLHDPAGSFVAGCVLGVVYLRTTSLAIPLAIHGLTNVVSFLWGWLELQGILPDLSPATTRVLLWQALVTLPPGAVWLIQFLRGRWAGRLCGPP